jgi:hypothetical protein
MTNAACSLRAEFFLLKRTLLQRPFQQEFWGALGTRSAIINYGKERGVRCKQAPPVRVSRSGGSQRESNWEHAEVAKRSPVRRDAKERERKCRTEERERETEKKKIINRERVRDESKMERGKHK